MRARWSGKRAAARRGFTLLELMVVVLIVAVLALLAAPALRTTRNDRICFDYARTYSAIIHRARVRAGARGGAHLVAINTAGVRGDIGLFESIDTTIPANGGPKPQSSCRLNLQWAGVPGFVPGGASPALSPVIEGMSIDATGNNDPAIAQWSNIRAQIRLNGVVVNAAVICYTPGGTVYVGTGGDVGAAITAMQVAQPFSGVLEIRIRRTDLGNNPIGLTRQVLIAGNSAPRVRSGAEVELP
jgi:prepilin-type N-terminal cleavage/methylation domain-containing protein